MSKQTKFLRLWLTFLFLSFSFNVLANGRTLELPPEIITTIAELVLDESPEGDLAGAQVYANNDRRNLRIDGSKMNEIRDLMDARRNGWEVRLLVETLRDKALDVNYEIVEVEILSRENKLTSGVLSTPRTQYEPIIAKTRTELNNLWRSAYPYDSNYYDANDNCFNRAQYWSRTHQYLQNEKGLNKGTDKIFIFFSQAYTKKFNHKWWYHVAPVLYMKNENNPYVFDSTFINRPVTMKEWLGAFDQHTSGECVQIKTLEEYYAKSHQPVCMYIVSSMYSYVPSDLGRTTLNNWRCSDFRSVLRSIEAPGANTSNPGARWSDPEFDYFLPENCR